MASFLIAAVLAVLVFLCMSDAIIAFSAVHSQRKPQHGSSAKTAGLATPRRREVLLSLGPRPEAKSPAEHSGPTPHPGATSSRPSQRSADGDEHFCAFSGGGRFGQSF